MLAEASTIIGLGKSSFDFLNFLKGVVGADVISSYHRFDGVRVEGSLNIEIELTKTNNDQEFFLSVKPLLEYVFVRFPINASGCEEIIGKTEGEEYADPTYWKWVQCSRSGTIVGGQNTPPNAKVDFIIVGYKPKALIKYLSS